jgi:5-methylcytosine-specific restriction endonuclease McrA
MPDSTCRSANFAHPANETYCRWPGCSDHHIEGFGLCQRHYFRARRVEDFSEPWILWVASCFVCGAEYCPGQLRRGRSYCSDGCRARAKRILHTDRERERRRNRYHAARAGGLSEKFSTAELRVRDGDSCYLCGELIDFDLKWPNTMSPSVDHVHPIALGGLHTKENAAMTHVKCNVRKGAKALQKKE